MCWLYFMTNLLVIQHLETLYLGGNHVRVVCERMWRIAQECAKNQGLAGGSRLQATRLMHMCQACQKLKRRTSCSLQDKSPRLTRPFAQDLNSRLNPVARSSRQNTLFGKIWLFTFLFTLLYIYIPLYPWFKENFQKELWERNPRENKIDLSTIFT